MLLNHFYYCHHQLCYQSDECLRTIEWINVASAVTNTHFVSMVVRNLEQENILWRQIFHNLETLGAWQLMKTIATLTTITLSRQVAQGNLILFIQYSWKRCIVHDWLFLELFSLMKIFLFSLKSSFSKISPVSNYSVFINLQENVYSDACFPLTFLTWLLYYRIA